MIRTVSTPAGFVPQQSVAFGDVDGPAYAVSRSAGLPIESAASATATAAIASGASLSGAVDLDRQRLHRIVVPAGWTAAAIGFQTSADGVAFGDLFGIDGEVLLPASIVAAGRELLVDPGSFFGVRYLKIRSGTSAAPVNQAAARTMTLATVAR